MLTLSLDKVDVPFLYGCPYDISYDVLLMSMCYKNILDDYKKDMVL